VFGVEGKWFVVAAGKSARKRDETSLPTGALRYSCPCGAEYLIAIHAGVSDDEWLETVRAAGISLDVGVVDGSRGSFVCEACGRTHLRGD